MATKVFLFLLLGHLCLTFASDLKVIEEVLQEESFNLDYNDGTTDYDDGTTTFIETTTEAHFCYDHGVTCTSSKQCCVEEQMLCFAESKPSGGHYSYGKCLCDNGYYWEHKLDKCVEYEGPSSVLTVVYIMFASFSLVLGLCMLFVACRFGCKNQGATRSYHGSMPQRVVILSQQSRTRMPVIPINDLPPKYNDLETVCKTMPGKDAPPPAYHDTISETTRTETFQEPEVSARNVVPNHTSFDHYGFYKSVQGWLKDEPDTNPQSGTDNPGFTTA